MKHAGGVSQISDLAVFCTTFIAIIPLGESCLTLDVDGFDGALQLACLALRRRKRRCGWVRPLVAC